MTAFPNDQTVTVKYRIRENERGMVDAVATDLDLKTTGASAEGAVAMLKQAAAVVFGSRDIELVEVA